MYQIGSGIWDGVFAVPNRVVDEHLRMASGLAVKVLLLLLRHGGRIEADVIAQELNQSHCDIQDALNFWQQAGLLLAEEKETTEPAIVIQYEEIPEKTGHSPERKVTTLSSERRRLSTQEINELADKDENITYLLQETQSVLGKALTPVSTDVVVALYSYYSMQPDLILMLIHYCVSMSKDSMRYIEKVAADWLDKGIDTHEKAEAEILRLTRINSAEGQIKKAFGIYDRNLVPSERKYIYTWTEEYRMALPLITLAYERAVEMKGKLSFPYINGILSNWHKNGITTTVQAMQAIRENRGKTEAKGNGKASYDISELEQMIAYGDL